MVVVSRCSSTWRPILLSHNFITSLFKLQQSNLRMRRCLLQCMDIGNLELPNFKRIYRRIHFADLKQWSISGWNVDHRISCCLLGLLANTDIYFGIMFKFWSALPPSRTPPRFWVHSLSYICCFYVSFVLNFLCKRSEILHVLFLCC